MTAPSDELMNEAERLVPGTVTPYTAEHRRNYISMVARALQSTAEKARAEERERCAAEADDLAADELFLDDKGRYGAKLAAATIRLDLAAIMAEKEPGHG